MIWRGLTEVTFVNKVRLNFFWSARAVSAGCLYDAVLIILSFSGNRIELNLYHHLICVKVLFCSVSEYKKLTNRTVTCMFSNLLVLDDA